MSTAEKDQIDAEIRASLKDMRRKFSEEYKAYKELKIKDEDRISPNNNAVESSFAILKERLRFFIANMLMRTDANSCRKHINFKFFFEQYLKSCESKTKLEIFQPRMF